MSMRYLPPNIQRIEMTGEQRSAISIRAGCGAAVAPAAANNFMITGPVQLSFLCCGLRYWL